MQNVGQYEECNEYRQHWSMEFTNKKKTLKNGVLLWNWSSIETWHSKNIAINTSSHYRVTNKKYPALLWKLFLFDLLCELLTQ